MQMNKEVSKRSFIHEKETKGLIAKFPGNFVPKYGNVCLKFKLFEDVCTPSKMFAHGVQTSLKVIFKFQLKVLFRGSQIYFSTFQFL